MATTIGALAYKIQLDSNEFTKGMKLSRQELNLVKKVMSDTKSPAAKLDVALESLEKLYRKGAITAGQLRKAQEKVRREFSKSAAPIQKTSGALGGLSQSIVGKFAVAGVAYMAWSKFTNLISSGARMAIGFIKSLADNVSDLDDKLNVMAKSGLASKEFEAIVNTGQKAGLTIKSLGKAMQDMTAGIAEAAQGKGEAKDVLEQLGLDPEKLNASGPFEALRSIANALKGVTNQADKLLIAEKLFGARGAQFVNVIANGSGALDDAAAKAEQFGTVLTKVQQDAISKAAAAFVDLKTVGMGLFTQLTAVGAPALQKVAESLIEIGLKGLDLIENHGPQMKEVFDDVANTVIWAASSISTLIDDLARLFKKMEDGDRVKMPLWLKALVHLMPGGNLLIGAADNALNDLNNAAGKVRKGQAGIGVGAGFGAGGGDGVDVAKIEQVKLQKEANETMDKLLKEAQEEAREAAMREESRVLSVKLLGNI